MWHEKQEAICLPSQKMHTPKSLQGVSMENKILTPHSGTSESSRKRKLIAVNKQDTISASNHEYISPKEASLQHETGSLFGRNLGENSLELLSNQSPLSIESTIFRHRSDKGPFDGQNNLPETKKTCNEYFCKAGAEKISNASSSVLLQSFHHRGSLLSKTLDGGTLTASTWRPQTYDMFIENEEHKKMPVLKSCDELAGVAKFGPCLQDGMNSKSKIFPVRENQSLDLCSSSSEYLRPLGLLQHSPVKYDRLETDLGGKLCSFEASQDGTSCDLKKSGGQTSNSAGVNVNSIVGTGSLFACVEQNENDMSVQNELQFRSGPLGLGLSDNYKKENDRGHGGGNIKILKQVEGSDVENFKCSFLKETGPKNGDCPPTVDIRNDLSHGSFQSYKNSKSLVRKEAPTVAKKLWEGSLQLNSSVTVLAVAFFKSGQKMPNIKWSESIEVKGKVRFEAFEKYIQDLPRSRNRGLMVISLCWKEGSSESGLAGMKKVAKGYKDGERVGFAPLSPGMDLYICPRSETVITILAKHGFFKGMAAVEDNQDSLIGCVVWRRNQANSNTVVKKSEKMEQSVNSPPDASTRRVVEDNMSHAQPADESIPVASGTDCATLGSIKNDGTETKNVEPSNIQLELDKPSAIIKPLPTPSVPRNSLSVLVEIKTSFSNRASHEDSLGQSLEVEAPQMHNSGREKAKPSLELQRPVVSLPSDIINKVASLPDDDDLPEFDFGISPVISQTLTSNPLDAVITNKKLRAGGPWNMDGSLPTMEPTVQSLIFNQRRLENSNLAKLPVGAIQKKTPLENFVEYGKIFGFPILEEKHTAQNIAVSTRRSRTAFPFSKSRFGEDEDDMPEWQPPNVDLHKQSVPETNPLLPSPSLVAIHPPFSAQAFPRAYNCHNTVTTRSTQPRPTNGYMPRGPRSFTRLNSETLLRPTSNTFDVKFPVHPASWRGWRS